MLIPRGRRYSGAGRAGRVHHGAFTLVEVMIAVALVLALSALVLPGLARRVQDWTFDSTASRLASVLAIARADAQREGRVLRVVVRAGEDGAAGVYEERVGGASAEDAAGTNAISGSAEGGAAAFAEPLLVLPAGYSVTAQRPVAADPRGAGATASGAAVRAESTVGRSENSEAEREMVLVLFLPDGSAVSEGSRYLVGPDGRGAEVRVNQWTGGVVVASWAADAVPALAGGRR